MKYYICDHRFESWFDAFYIQVHWSTVDMEEKKLFGYMDYYCYCGRSHISKHLELYEENQWKNFRRLGCTDFKKLLIGLDQLYEKLETTSIGSDKKLAIGNIVHNQKAG